MSLGVALACLLALGILAWALLPIVLEATVHAPEPASDVTELEDLYIQREGTYATLKELDFDHETGKLIEEDYHELRTRYSDEAYRILQRIDELEASRIESRVLTAAIETRELVKEYGFRRALDGVTLEVPRGTFFTLFGPNGAGKTTLVRILTGVSRPTEGSVRIAGAELRGAGRALARSKIGFLSHQSLVYDGLTGLENLLFFARLHRLNAPRERAQALLEELRLWDRRNDLAGSYSRGMLQRLAIARALLHDPEILLLDEPFTGLDPAAARLLAELLARLRRAGRSALLVTHDLEEGLALSDRWAVLVDGRIAVRGESVDTSPSQLIAVYFDAVGVPAGRTSLSAPGSP